MSDNRSEEEDLSETTKPPQWLLMLGFTGVVFLLIGESLHQLSPDLRDFLVGLLIGPMAAWEVYHMHRSGLTTLQNSQKFKRDDFPALFKLLMAVFGLLAVSPVIIALQWYFG